MAARAGTTWSQFVNGSEKQKPMLRLGDPRNLESITEEMNGEKMTPDDVQAFAILAPATRRVVVCASEHH